jgi:hypothetical protein
MGKVLTRLGLGGLVVLLVAFAIGCGGDDSSSGGDSSASAESSTGDSTTEPEVTQKDFVAEADKICKSKTQEVAKTLTESNKAQTAATTQETLASEELVQTASNKVADITDHLADVSSAITKQLSKLETPNQKALDQLVKAREVAAKDLYDLADTWRSYGKNPTQATVDDITSAQESNVKTAATATKAAEKAGLKVCGQPVKPA